MIRETDNSTGALPPAVGLSDLLSLLRRRIRLILLPTVALTGVAAVVLAGVAPRYSAKALLMIDDRAANPVKMEMAISGLTGDTEAVMSEIELLKSARLANGVIEELRLEEQPEFNAALRPPGLLERILSAAKPAASTNTTAADSPGQRVRVIKVFLDRLNVHLRPDSRVISVAFSSEDAQLAASVANTLSMLYLQDQLESKFETVQRASAWLNDRISSLRSKVLESERRVEEYREESGLLEGGGTTLTDQEVSQLNSELIAASNVRAAAEAELDHVRDLMDSQTGAAIIGEVLNSPLIQRLREQQVGVLRQVAELSTEYGERHPTMVKLRADAADLETKIDAEIAKIVGGLESELDIARGREAAAKSKLYLAKRRVGENNKALVTLRSLEREAQANRLLLETMLARFTETSAQDDLASMRPDARIISEALVPNEPSWPMSKAILAIVFVSAAFLGVMLAFAKELLDDGLRSGEQLEAVTGVRSLGFIPSLGRRALAKRTPADYLLEHPVSAYAESINAIFAALVHARGHRNSYSVLVTSSQTKDGKSTLAASLARSVAKAGDPVIIVDADCRDPKIAKIMGVDSEKGLSDVLGGCAELDEAIVKDPASGADVLCAGPTPGNPPAMFASTEVKKLLKTLAKRYELVVLDSPPTMAVSDPLILSNVVDGTLLAARWGTTRRASVALAVRKLTGAGANLIGAVLTRVDVKEYARYGYGDSGAYTGDLLRYYNLSPARE